MEVEEIQLQAHGCKFQRISSSNGRSDSFNKLGQTERDQLAADDEEEDEETKKSGESTEIGGGGGFPRPVCGWPGSRIVRASPGTGGKDRHSKVWTSKGLRDRRVRLSVSTAIQFYDLQDRLGYDQPSKAVEWLLKAAAESIDELPSINTSSFPDNPKQLSDGRRRTAEQRMESADAEFDGCPNYYYNQHQQNPNQNQLVSLSKSACSTSTSETSKGSGGGLSLSRSESRIKARERARERKAEKEKDKDDENANPISQNSFTELLTGGPSGSTQQSHGGGGDGDQTNLFARLGLQWASSSAPMEYFTPISRIRELLHHPEMQKFSFIPAAEAGGDGGGGNDYNLNFPISSGLSGSFNRGTLQSNSLSMLPHLQRMSAIDGPNNVPFFFGTSGPTAAPAGLADGPLQLCYDGGRNSDQKGKGKNS